MKFISDMGRGSGGESRGRERKATGKERKKERKKEGKPGKLSCGQKQATTHLHVLTYHLVCGWNSLRFLNIYVS
jgi:hypothetical protein